MEKDIAYTQRDLETHDAIGMIIRNPDGKFLCFYHKKFDFWTLPLGKTEAEETPEKAVAKEAYEELDIHVKQTRKIFQFTQVYTRKERQIIAFFFLYEIADYSGNLTNKEHHKHSEMKFLSIDELRKLRKTSDAVYKLIHVIDDLEIYR